MVTPTRDTPRVKRIPFNRLHEDVQRAIKKVRISRRLGTGWATLTAGTSLPHTNQMVRSVHYGVLEKIQALRKGGAEWAIGYSPRELGGYLSFSIHKDALWLHPDTKAERKKLAAQDRLVGRMIGHEWYYRVPLNDQRLIEASRTKAIF